jgi:hypothetical protein
MLPFFSIVNQENPVVYLNNYSGMQYGDMWLTGKHREYAFRDLAILDSPYPWSAR